MQFSVTTVMLFLSPVEQRELWLWTIRTLLLLSPKNNILYLLWLTKLTNTIWSKNVNSFVHIIGSISSNLHKENKIKDTMQSHAQI